MTIFIETTIVSGSKESKPQGAEYRKREQKAHRWELDMQKSKKRNCILYIVGIISLLAVVIVCIKLPDWFQKQDTAVQEVTYDKEVFDKDKIMSVAIEIEETDWDAMLAAPLEKTYYPCSIVINGERYEQVGIRTKGNSSLKRVAEEGDSVRYGFKIEFDHYVKGQTCHGLDKMILNTHYADATCMKEYLAYDMHSRMGIATPLFSYADLTINETAWGLYLAVESIEEGFLQRNYGTTEGQLYKPDYTQSGLFYKGADLSYRGEDPENYETILNSAKLGALSEEDISRMITSLRHLEEKSDLETYIDVDQMLRLLSVNVCLMNDDSYFGSQIHNYYLYQNGERLIMLPWDYNLAFGGYTPESPNEAIAEMINRPVDSVIPLEAWEKRPMIKRLLQVEAYKEQYHVYLDEFLTEYFESGVFEQEIDRLHKLIGERVKADPTAFYSYEQYLEAIAMLKKTGMRRAECIRLQLDGKIGATHAEQAGKLENLVPVTDLDFQVMGNLRDFGGEADSQ